MNIPPSGPWFGYYLYGHSGQRHRMRLNLTFTLDGKLFGDGIDDVGPFLIRGVFISLNQQASWTKSYIGRHSVEYMGIYDGRSICGDWTLVMMSGGFWIWPGGLEEGIAESVEEEIEQPTVAQLV